MQPTSNSRIRRLSGRSHLGLSAAQNLVRSKKRLTVERATLNSEPAHPPHHVPAQVTGAFWYEGGTLALPFELTAEDAVRLGAALIAAGRDALGVALPGEIEPRGGDADAVIELAEALEALRPPRL